MANSNVIVVGSSSESHIGVGTLMKWNAEDVFVDRDEDGTWMVRERLPEGGYITFLCYDVMKFEAGSAIDPIDLGQ
jgi:hypothetical protein